LIRLQTEPIRIERLVEAALTDADGALALFLGTVRNHNQGRRVLRLEYHAYPEMALRELERIESEAKRRFTISNVATVHRTGELEIGEVSVAIAVAASHRDEAFRACRFVIDTLKRRVPIWKKEYFEGGEVWIEEPGSGG
jgi:molybdopterin synthase catalytic subunit